MADRGALITRFGSDTSAVQRGMADLTARIASNMAQVAQVTATAGKAMQSSWSAALTAMGSDQTRFNAAVGGMTRASGVVLAVYLAYKALSGAIGAARSQIEEMIAVGEKAEKANVGGNFFQRFVADSRRLTVPAKDFEAALDHAFNATKDKSPIDLSKWETGEEQINDVEKALRVFNATGEKLQGLVLFRDATSQEQKLEAVLIAMTELNKQGRQLESLQLGEKMFGDKFVDNIRRGQTSAESVLKSMQLAKEAGTGLFSDAMIARAKEVNDKLEEANQKLARELKPQWDSLARSLLDIKSLWADVIKLIGDAAAAVNKIDLSIKEDELRRVKAAMASGESLIPGIPRLGNSDAIQQRLAARAARLEGEIAELKGDASPLAKLAGIDDIRGPSRGAGKAPTKKKDDSSRDRFDAAVDSIEKRTAALDAEARTIDLGTEARNKARIAAELETVAKQINAEAGKGANVVTEEQRQKIDAVAEAYGRAARAIENARSPLATFARESADVNARLNEFAAGSLNDLTSEGAKVITMTQSVSAAFKNMAQSIINDLARIAIRRAITGPLAGLIGSALGSLTGGAGAAFTGSAVGSGGINTLPFGGPRANGGDLFAGRAYSVGELGREIFVPKADGRMYPIGRGGAGGGGTTNHIAINIPLAGANGDAAIHAIVMRATTRALAQVPGIAVRSVAESARRF